MNRYTTILLKSGNYNTLYYSDDILASGEPAIAIDSGVLKVGNGSNDWASLPAVGIISNPIGISGASGILNMVQISQSDYDLLTPDPNVVYFIK